MTAPTIVLNRSPNYPYVFIETELPIGVTKKVDELTSFYPKDYDRTDSYTAGRWDGKVHLLQKTIKAPKQYFFPAGLLYRVVQYLRAKGYRIEYYAPPRPEKEFEMEWHGHKLRDYQTTTKDAAIKVMNTGLGCILKMATASGKTLVAMKIIQELGLRTLILVDGMELINQWNENIKKSLRVTPAIFDANRKFFDHITIASVDSLHAALNNDSTRSMIIRELAKFDVICSDESHHDSCNSVYDILMKAPGYYKLGLSVDASSYVELKDGVFGNGWTGRIEDAWWIAEKEYERTTDDGYEILHVDGKIKTRGWENGNFTWKQVKSMIRHENTKKGINIKAGGDNLILTKEHSIYKAIDGNYTWIDNQKKYQPEMVESNAADLKVGDILLQDNGNDWNRGEEEDNTTILDILMKSGINKDKTHVVVDFEKHITHMDMRIEYKDWRGKTDKNGKKIYGASLTLREYEQFKDRLPRPTKLYTEGARGIYANPNLKISDMAYLMGFYIGNGWTDEKRFVLATNYRQKDKVEEELDNLDGCKIGIQWKQTKGKSYEARCSNSIIQEVFVKYFGGMRAWTKKIPCHWLISWNEEARRQLLQGMIDSDGHMRKEDKRIHITTTSKELARDILCILRSIEINGSINERKEGNGGTVNGRQIIGKRVVYDVHLSYNALTRKNEGHGGTRQKYTHDDKHFNERPVRKTKEEMTSTIVYDMEVEGHASFCANGLLAHNSATPYRTDNEELKMYGAIGDIIEPVTTKWLIDNEFIAVPKFYFVNLSSWKHKAQTKEDKEKVTPKNKRSMEWRRAYRSGIADNDERNNKIVEWSTELTMRGYQVYIHVTMISHGKKLESMIPGSVFLHGTDGKKTREWVLAQFKEGKIRILISTLLGEATDLPKLDAIVMAAGGASKIQAIQRAGRALRLSPGKKQGMIIDFKDTGWPLRNHYLERLSAYIAEYGEEIVKGK